MNYQTRSLFGWAVIIAISLFPVYLLFAYGNTVQEFFDYESVTHTLGEVFGLVGMTMFAMTFVLSTRIKWIEDVFGGLDKVYLTHGILGGTALVLILAHPIFLVLKFIPQDFNTAAKYLLPSSAWSVNFGIIALLGMMLLIGITLFSKMKYNIWKFTHEFLGAMFILAALHIFLVRGTASSDDIFTGYYWYAGVVSSIGILAFSYSLFLKNRIMKNAVYIVEKIANKKDLFEIIMIPEHKPIRYQSGQFVFVRFYNEGLSREAHPFSIASKSNEERIKIVIKKLGDYTSKMENLKVGDKVSVEGPYGRFHFKNYENKNQVWIAAGIGITPFMGMAQDLEFESPDCKVELYYTAKDSSDFIGYERFRRISMENKNFKFFPWNSDEKGRISPEVIINNTKDIKNKQFLICGGSAFKESMISGLVKAGVDINNIHEEAFDFR
ncbi:MAG TPA: ferric reductase-like transmembrane domain-containing protein [Candidatus Nanoarchaeia archaeon]|nr:ferric reductase-like transmembrane domain-containing protein [Candidatus Nanoarchaeia archaeon]